jgi:hypothetical protein
MAADTSMDIDMDFELDIDNDEELARLQAGTAALSAVRDLMWNKCVKRAAIADGKDSYHPHYNLRMNPMR